MFSKLACREVAFICGDVSSAVAARAACFSAIVKWRSFHRSTESALFELFSALARDGAQIGNGPHRFLARSLFQLIEKGACRMPAFTNGRMLIRTPSFRSGFQLIGCSASDFQRT